jgi:hypothetical protein
MYDNSIIVAADIENDAVAEKIGARERCPQLSKVSRLQYLTLRIPIL